MIKQNLLVNKELMSKLSTNECNLASRNLQTQSNLFFEQQFISH